MTHYDGESRLCVKDPVKSLWTTDGLLVGMPNDTITLENSLTVPCKVISYTIHFYIFTKRK